MKPSHLTPFLVFSLLLYGSPGLATAPLYLSLVYIVSLAFRRLRNMPGHGAQTQSMKFGEGVLINLLNPGLCSQPRAHVPIRQRKAGAVQIVFTVLLVSGVLIATFWSKSNA